MTRTFVAGGERAAARSCRSTGSSPARRSTASMPMIRAGADCREIYAASCEPYEAAGKPTVATKEPDTALEEGYYHGLGHGVGLEVHERPNLGRSDGRR